MTIRIRLILLVALALAQMGVPGALIYRHESVLHEGKAFKFRVAPVDPYDAFRGRFVALAFERTDAPAPPELSGRRGRAWARITGGPDGFAQFEEVTARKPVSGDFVEVRLTYVYQGRAHFRLPFDRFYMEESAAPEAEQALWRRTPGQVGRRMVYVVVRILDGQAVTEQLFLDGVPIAQYLRENSPARF